MTIDTSLVRDWVENYERVFKTNPSDYAKGVMGTCKGLLVVLDNYETIEGYKIAQEQEA